VDQTFDAGFEFDERTIFGDVGDRTLKLGADGIFGNSRIPRIAFQLLHAKADALRVLVDTNDLYLNRVTNVDDFAWVVDALVADVGDVQQAIDAAQIDERTIIGDVLDNAVDDLAFGEVLDKARALFCACFFQNGATRYNDVATLAVHFQDNEGLSDVHQWRNVTDWTNVNLAAGQECHCAAQINGETTLYAAEDNAINAVACVKFAFQHIPSGFATGAIAAEHGFAVHIFYAVYEDFDFVANLQVGFLAGHSEFTQRHTAFGFETHIDDSMVIVDCGYGALYDTAFKACVCATK
jgi:hypothetical protein